MSMRVLVTDGEHRAALAVVRSLGARGHHVYVCSSHPRPIAAASRYCCAASQVPDALAWPHAFVGAVAEQCREWRIQVLLPITEPGIMALSPEAEQFPDVCMPVPSFDSFMTLSDKAKLMRIAPRFGFSVPQQIELASVDELSTIEWSTVQFPLVIKPARSVGLGPNGRKTFEVGYAHSAEQLRTRIRQLADTAFPVLLQQRVSGPGSGVMVLMWAGVEQAVFAHRRLREKPPSGGVSVYSESTAADPQLIGGVIELLRQHQWSGVAMAEFKQDRHTGKVYLMEVNGRFWGSLQLAIDAGVDFPALLLDCVEFGSAKHRAGYRPGVKLRWWWGDFDQLLLRLFKSRSALNLPHGFPGRMQAVREFMRWRPGDRSEVLRWPDPWPGMVETLNWLRKR